MLGVNPYTGQLQPGLWMDTSTRTDRTAGMDATGSARIPDVRKHRRSTSRDGLGDGHFMRVAMLPRELVHVPLVPVRAPPVRPGR